MSGILRRRAMMHGEALPYDAEVQYLRFTGAQYVDTGIDANVTNVDAEVTLRIDDSTQIYGILSAFRNVTSYRYYLMDYNAGYIYTCKFPGTFTWDNAARLTYSDTSSLRTYQSSQTSSSVTITRPATSASDTKNVSSSSQVNLTYYLGARHTIDQGAQRLFSGDIQSCWIRQNGILVFDVISVRVGTAGYFYDRATGRLFGNAGGGAFIVGPDVYTP